MDEKQLRGKRVGKAVSFAYFVALVAFLFLVPPVTIVAIVASGGFQSVGQVLLLTIVLAAPFWAAAGLLIYVVRSGRMKPDDPFSMHRIAPERSFETELVDEERPTIQPAKHVKRSSSQRKRLLLVSICAAGSLLAILNVILRPSAWLFSVLLAVAVLFSLVTERKQTG